MDGQMVIPGMESMVSLEPKGKAKRSIRQEMAGLQSRVLQLELELTLLRIQLEGADGHE